MNLEIYHQLGFQYKWNLKSLADDRTGTGVIIAPRFMGPKDLASLSPDVIGSAIFDPQFFLPNTPLGKLGEYDFFPDKVADGFQTSDYSDDLAFKSAEKCVKFQDESNFRYVVIPTRYTTGMPTNFIRDQQELFVAPFLDSIKRQGVKKKILIQLVLSEGMVKDKEYSADLLNWITGIEAISGVYLIVEVSQRPKQIADIDFLFAYLKFIDALNQNQLDVILGYLNTEALLLSIASPKILTIGTYENTRMFNIRNFRVKEKRKQVGPNARLYISKLLQWVDYRYLGAITRTHPDGLDFFDANQYQALMFEPTFNWHFSKTEIYLHYFLVFERQLRCLAHLKDVERYNAMTIFIKTAISNYDILSDEIVFDRDSNDTHLSAWLTAANQFAKMKGWR